MRQSDRVKGRWAAALWLLFGLASAVGAAVPPGRPLLDAWLDAYNAGQRDAIEAFRQKYGLKVDADDVLAWREDSGPVALLKVERDEPGVIAALLQPSSSDTVERIEFALVPGPPVKIASLTYLNAERPAEFALPRLSQAEALAALRRRGDELAAQDRFAGVVLVARGDEILARHAWGLADRAAGIEADAGTRFRLGSMNKMFTAIAVLQLVEAGKLGLDDALARHLPDYPNRAFAERVTVRHLLSHTGGAGDIFGPEFDQRRETLRRHADYVALYGGRAPDFPPGSRFRYANYGFVLLGALVEAVAGQDYHDYVEQHVFDRAGMRDAGSQPENEPVPDRARAYRREQGRWVDAADTLPWRGTAAGGGYASADDLWRFARALQAGRLVSPALLAQALQPQTKDGWYGLGFITRGHDAARWYGHDGGAQGMNAVLHHYPDAGYTVIALSNLDPPAAERLAEFFENRMPLAPAALKAAP